MRKILSNCPVSCFADEISVSLDRQIQVLNELGIKFVEFRSADGTGVADFTDEQAKEAKKRLDAAEIRVSAVGSPIGKIGIEDDFEAHMKKLQRIEHIADIFETPYIRMFSFYLPENADQKDYRDAVMKRMERMVQEAKASRLVLLHENEKGIYGDNATRCLDLMKEFYGDHFKATFDFANFIQCGQNTIEAYEMLKPYIEYVHVKDARMADGEVVVPGTGDGQLVAIFDKLDQSGYKGYLSLEPHLANFAGLGSLEKEAAVRAENDTEKAFCIAYRALEGLLGK